MPAVTKCFFGGEGDSEEEVPCFFEKEGHPSLFSGHLNRCFHFLLLSEKHFYAGSNHITYYCYSGKVFSLPRSLFLFRLLNFPFFF